MLRDGMNGYAQICDEQIMYETKEANQRELHSKCLLFGSIGEDGCKFKVLIVTT